MSVKIIFKSLKNDHFSFNAAVFLPPKEARRNIHALFTHGYTASKSDNIAWAQRLSEAGIPCAIFDLPGHYLGSLNTVDSFEDFKQHAHKGFITAAQFLGEEIGEATEPERYILGGHSLGALLSVKALALPMFENTESLALGVGLGIGQHKTTHIFESSFYQKTLNIRRQLVCPELDSSNVFPWINEEKRSITLAGKRVHLITGEDDVVVGEGGMAAFHKHLEDQGNTVTSQAPKKLPHHEPSMAATHVFHFLKKELGL